MTTKQRKKAIFRSIEEFRHYYQLESHKYRIMESSEEARTFGATLARQSVDILKRKLEDA